MYILKYLPRRDGRGRGRNTDGRRGSAARGSILLRNAVAGAQSRPHLHRHVPLRWFASLSTFLCCFVLVLITCKQMRTPLSPWLSSTLPTTRARRHCQGKCLYATLHSWSPCSVDGFPCGFNDDGGVLRRWIKRIHNGQVGKNRILVKIYCLLFGAIRTWAMVFRLLLKGVLKRVFRYMSIWKSSILKMSL